MDMIPKTESHQQFAQATCARVYVSSKELSRETRKFILCARENVLKTDDRKSARRTIFSCAEKYPPKRKQFPLDLARYYFPTNEELAEIAASERASQRSREMLLRELSSPSNCHVVEDTITCF